MKKYLYVNPRGFANEFAVYAVSPDQMPEAEKMVEGAANDTQGSVKFIPRKEAEALTASCRKQARDYRKAGINLSENPVGATAIEDFAEMLKWREDMEV